MLLLKKAKYAPPRDRQGGAPSSQPFSQAAEQPSAPKKQKEWWEDSDPWWDKTDNPPPGRGVQNMPVVPEGPRQAPSSDQHRRYMGTQDWGMTWDSQNPWHIDTKFEQKSIGLPHADAAPSLGKLQEDTSTVPMGVSYDYYHLMPPGRFNSGIYHDGNGRRWFVKKGLVESPFQHQHALENPQVFSFMHGRVGGPLDRSHAARHEHTVHRLYDYFATPENNIRSVRSTLHSDQQNGAAVPDTFKWNPTIAGYSVTPELFGRNRSAAKTFFELPDNLKRKYKTQLLDGVAVDALLGAGDTHGGNFMAVPGENGVFRIDTGAHMGMTPFGFKAPASSGFVPQQSDPNDPDGGGASGNWHGQYILPDLKRLVSELYDPDQNASGLENMPQTRGEYVRFARGVGDKVLRSAAAMLDKFDNDPDGFRRALVHHPDSGDMGKILSERLQVYRRMLDKFRDHPDVLGQILLGKIPNDYPAGKSDATEPSAKSLYAPLILSSNNYIMPSRKQRVSNFDNILKSVLHFYSRTKG